MWYLSFNDDVIVYFSLSVVGAALIPSLLNVLWVRPNKDTFLYALSYGTMAIFMFAYHVHEKTVLIPLLPILMLANQSPSFVFWFVIQSTFSIYPLMEQDKLQIPYVIVLSLWVLYSYALIKWRLVGFGWKMLNTVPCTLYLAKFRLPYYQWEYIIWVLIL